MKDNRNDISENVGNSLTIVQNNNTAEQLPVIANEIDSYYKQGAMLYAETMGRYNIEIEKLQNRIKRAKSNKHKEETKLLALEQELALDYRVLEQLQDEFMQKLNSIEELNAEYKELIDEAGYRKLLSHKTRELKRVENKIDELEISYLSNELEHINLLSKLEPKRRYIDTLVENIKELELEKEHFAVTKLHQLPQMAFTHNDNSHKNKEVVDTSILEDES
jgi:chromosome segregation ATPase